MVNQKIALVTGGNRGIGLACVRQLAQRGYQTIMGSRDLELGRAARISLGPLGDNIDVIPLDIANRKTIEDARLFVMEQYGRLDILINNAAIHYDSWHNVVQADLEEVALTLDVNLLGPWRIAQAMMPFMLKARSGRVVNVSSEAGSMATMDAAAPGYGVSKAALNALTIKLAAFSREKGVLVNAVCPGWVQTQMGGESAPRSVEEGAASILWAVDLPDDGPSGGFFCDGKPLPW